MSIVLQSSGGGSVTLQEPSTASNVTVTIPASTGTAMVSGNMPAFGVYNGATTLMATGTNIKILFNTKEYDTANCFDTSTSKFTPNVAGYYQINAGVTVQATGSFYMITTIFKNGAAFKQGAISGGNASAYNEGTVSSLVYMNGTTDYLEIFAAQNTGSSYNTYNASTNTYFNGYLARSA